MHLRPSEDCKRVWPKIDRGKIMTLTPEYLAELNRLCDEATEASSVDEPVARSFYASSLRQGFSALPALIAEVERLTAQAIDRDFSLLEDAKTLKKRATAAEAERDRLRIALSNLHGWVERSIRPNYTKRKPEPEYCTEYMAFAAAALESNP
jgi:hypothetical protein